MAHFTVANFGYSQNGKTNPLVTDWFMVQFHLLLSPFSAQCHAGKFLFSSFLFPSALVLARWFRAEEESSKSWVLWFLTLKIWRTKWWARVFIFSHKWMLVCCFALLRLLLLHASITVESWNNSSCALLSIHRSNLAFGLLVVVLVVAKPCPAYSLQDLWTWWTHKHTRTHSPTLCSVAHHPSFASAAGKKHAVLSLFSHTWWGRRVLVPRCHRIDHGRDWGCSGSRIKRQDNFLSPSFHTPILLLPDFQSDRTLLPLGDSGSVVSSTGSHGFHVLQICGGSSSDTSAPAGSLRVQFSFCWH